MDLFDSIQTNTLIDEFTSDVSTAPQALKDEFCKLWKSAKAALEIALKLIKNPIAQSVIKVAIAAGDALYSALGCK